MAQVRQERVQVIVEINGQQRVGQTLGEIEKQYKQLNRELKQLPIGTEEYQKKVEELRGVKKILDDQRVAMRAVKEETKGAAQETGKLPAFFQRAGAAFIAAFAVDKIAGFFQEFRKQAGQIEAVNRRFSVVFGESADAVDQFGKRSAEALGFSQNEFRAAAASVGDLLIPMGFARDVTAGLTTDLISISAALSEWSNGQFDSAQVTDILTKALLGEREELKALGISISEADVQTKLAEKGQKDFTGAALEQAKAMATLELITAKSVDARTSYANQSNNIARQEAQITASVKNQAEALTNALAPAYSAVLGFVARLLGAQNRLSDQYIKEQTELNVLVSRIGRLNEGNEEREKLITELNQRYPTFLGNLDAEKVTNQQLTARLREVNQEYITKIVLQQEDEKIQEQATEAAKRKRQELEAELALEKQLLRQKQLLGIETQAGLSIQEDFREVISQIRDLERSGQFGTGATDIALKNINLAYLQYENTLERVAREEGELVALQEKREELAKRLGVSAPVASVAPEIVIATSSDLSAEEQEALAEKARKRRELREQQERDLAKKIEDLQADLIDDSLLKQIRQIEIRAQREIAALEGSAEQVAQARRLIEERSSRDILAAIEADVDAQQALRDSQSAKALSKEQEAKRRELAQLDAFHQKRLSEITQQVLEEAQAGSFSNQEEAEKAIQDRLLVQLREYLEKRKALLVSFGEDVSEIEKQIAELDLANLFENSATAGAPDPGAELWESISEGADVAKQVISEFYSFQAAQARSAYQEEQNALEEAKKRELSVRGLTEQRRAQIEAKYAGQRDALDKKFKESERRRAITQSIIDTAILVVKGLATPPAPNIAAGALAGILGGIQTAAIVAAKFEKGGRLPVKAGRGGMTEGPRHSSGGIDLVDSQTGRKVGEVEGGETILSRDFTRNNPTWVKKALYSSQHLGGAPIFEDGGTITSLSTTPSAATLESFGAFDDQNIVRELVALRETVGRLSLRIGEYEAVLIAEMAQDYEIARTKTRL